MKQLAILVKELAALREAASRNKSILDGSYYLLIREKRKDIKITTDELISLCLTHPLIDACKRLETDQSVLSIAVIHANQILSDEPN